MASADIYNELRDEIISGTRPPGSALVEAELASYFGVSRTPVREALFKLVKDGLVERNGRSIKVRQYSPEMILESFDIRLVLEGLAARIAAIRRTDLDLVRIKSAYSALKLVDATDSKETRATINALRSRIWAAGHNSMLTSMLNDVYAHSPHFLESTLTMPGKWDEVITAYDAIISSIEEHRHHDAEQHTVTYLNSLMQARLELLALQPDSELGLS